MPELPALPSGPDNDRRLIATAPGRLALVDLEDGWGVYDRWTGDIHVASPLAGQILSRLSVGGAETVPALLAWLASEFEADGEGDLAAAVADTVGQLAATGLIDRTDAATAAAGDAPA